MFLSDTVVEIGFRRVVGVDEVECVGGGRGGGARHDLILRLGGCALRGQTDVADDVGDGAGRVWWGIAKDVRGSTAWAGSRGEVLRGYLRGD